MGKKIKERILCWNESTMLFHWFETVIGRACFLITDKIEIWIILPIFPLYYPAQFEGSLIQVPMSEKGKITRGRLGSLSLKKEGERQCFLFSKHLIICTRGSGGKLHLTKVISRFICIMDHFLEWFLKYSPETSPQ